MKDLSREILFRGKGKGLKQGEWIYGSFVEDTDLNACCIRDKSLVYELVDRETVGQYTGLTDKNGKKIFEGDICKVTYLDRRCNSNGKHYLAENEMIEKVVFKNGAFCFKVIIEDIAMYRPIGFDIYEKQKIKYVEVIGNIYDNPELLEVEE